MIRIILPIKRGFSGWPFYVIPKWCVDTPRQTPYENHEKTHCKRQRWITPIWWIRYALSKSFRRQEELLAYKTEMFTIMDQGRNIDIPYFSEQLATNYWGMINYVDAHTWVLGVIALWKQKV